MWILPLYLLAFVIAIIVVSYGLAVARVLGVRLRAERAVRVFESERAPDEIVSGLQAHAAALDALGFEQIGALSEADPLEGVDQPLWSLLYRSSDRRTLARVSFADSPTRAQPVDVSFMSFVCADAGPAGRETLFETVAWRAHRLSRGLPGHALEDAQTLSWTQQWQHHQRRLAEADGRVLSIEGREDFASRLRAFRERTLGFELAEGRVRECRDGSLRHGLGAAVSLVVRANRGEGARLRALAAAGRQQDDERDLLPDLMAHRRRAAIERSRRAGSRLQKSLLFVGSMLLFLLAFGIAFSIETVLMVIVVLIIHELGHALAMRAFGYRDLQVLFIPFIGAVASGKKEDVAPWQEVVVLLAGPIPGILIGTWLRVSGLATGNELLYTFANIMILLNYLNLLPFVPLDGGRVMSIVFFDRFPTVQFAFSTASSVAIGAAGIYLGEYILAGVGVVLLLGAPRQLAQARTFVRMRGLLTRAGRAAADPLRLVYAELQSRRFDRWNGETRYQFVNHVMERLGRDLAGWRLVTASIATYVAIVALPLDALLDDLSARNARMRLELDQREVAAALADPRGETSATSKGTELAWLLSAPRLGDPADAR